MNVVGHGVADRAVLVLIPHIGEAGRDAAGLEHRLLGVPTAVGVEQEKSLLSERFSHRGEIGAQGFAGRENPVAEVQGVDDVELAGTRLAHVFLEQGHALGRITERRDVVLASPGERRTVDVDAGGRTVGFRFDPGGAQERRSAEVLAHGERTALEARAKRLVDEADFVFRRLHAELVEFVLVRGLRRVLGARFLRGRAGLLGDGVGLRGPGGGLFGGNFRGRRAAQVGLL